MNAEFDHRDTTASMASRMHAVLWQQGVHKRKTRKYMTSLSTTKHASIVHMKLQTGH